MLRRVIDLDLLCVYVTFVDELASLGEATASMRRGRPGQPSRADLRVVRRPADGLAYAAAIAEKYRLTYQWVQERVRS